ncbi:TyrS-associated PheT N-terminal domain-related protein TapR [Mycoplasma nasistruthionis]|uniref:tRNA-binding domain-containing protein n=1 Tax=Mycoplasma nasistruthionis TaxID=353852 RepID=A0A4Y6I6L4_9MOLU|nr:hypothetical protein [Mycoplasma nasistruthionis]QDF65011.1 hypothetical protein FIV53_01710 [Mycoplasma nasistruthionis]
MILLNNLDKSFSNTSVILVDASLKYDSTVYSDKFVFFVDAEKQVISANLLDNSYLNIHSNTKYAPLNQNQVQLFVKEASDKGLKVLDKPKFKYVKVLDKQNHPKSEKLFVLTLLENVVSNQTRQLVTNRQDVKVGDVLVMAMPGTTLLSGLEILEGEIMGVFSPGMLVSLGSFELEPVSSDLIFATDDKIGTDYEFFVEASR